MSLAAAAIAASEENVNRNAQIQECRRQIIIWSDRLKSLEEERTKQILCAKLRHDAIEYAPKLTVKDRRDTDILLAAIESRDPLPFLKYVAKDNHEEGVKFHSPLQSPPFIPEDLLGRKDIALALMKLPDFREGIECFIGDAYMRVPDALNSISDREYLISLYSACPRLFEFATEEMKNDRECVLALVRNNETGVFSDGSRFIPKKFWTDKEVLLAALSESGVRVRTVDIEKAFASIPASSPLRDDLDIARVSLKRAAYIFPFLSKRLRGNRAVLEMLFAQKWTIGLLQHCIDEDKSDKELVLRFCQRNGRQLEHASPSLQANEEVVRTACMKDGCALKFCSPELRKRLLRDGDFVGACIKTSTSPEILELLPAEMLVDEAVILSQVRFPGYKNYLSEDLKKNKQFLLKMLKIEPANYALLPESQQNDYDMLRTAVINGALDVFGEKAWHDKEDFEELFERFPQLLADEELFVSTLNQGAWYDLSHFDEHFFVRNVLPVVQRSFANSIDFWIALCKQDACSLKFVPSEFQNDFRVINAALSADQAMLIIDEVPAWAQKDHPELIIEFVKKCHIEDASTKQVFDLFPSKVWSNRDVANAFAASYDSALLYLPKEYKSDRQVVLSAISHSYREGFATANPSLRNDLEFVRQMIATDYRSFGLIPEHLRNDFSIQLLAMSKDSRSISYLGNLRWGRVPDSEEAFDLRADFAETVRKMVSLKESFVMDFLRGIDVVGSSAEKSPLAVLALGDETVLVIKSRIAEYAGIPLGKELHQLVEVSENLIMEGF